MSFQDLLSLTAELLRGNPIVRHDLGRRYSRLLIDEFQDTDPIQAEIVFLLASDPDAAGPTGSAGSAGSVDRGGLESRDAPAWRTLRRRRSQAEHLPVSPRRHRPVRARPGALRGLWFAVLRLQANFRSVRDIASIVNEVFDEAYSRRKAIGIARGPQPC